MLKLREEPLCSPSSAKALALQLPPHLTAQTTATCGCGSRVQAVAALSSQRHSDPDQHILAALTPPPPKQFATASWYRLRHRCNVTHQILREISRPSSPSVPSVAASPAVARPREVTVRIATAIASTLRIKFCDR